jgi:sulfur carrier protein
MQITINNQPYQFNEASSLEGILDSLKLIETAGIAVALNEAIIPKSEWNKTMPSDEDKIIIIGAVAGG